MNRISSQRWCDCPGVEGTGCENRRILCLYPIRQERCLSMATHSELLLTPKEANQLLAIPLGTLAPFRSQRRVPPSIMLEECRDDYRRSVVEQSLSGHPVETRQLRLV